MCEVNFINACTSFNNELAADSADCIDSVITTCEVNCRNTLNILNEDLNFFFYESSRSTSGDLGVSSQYSSSCARSRGDLGEI